MSIVKDLLFILTALAGIFYVLHLNRHLAKQKKYFLDTLKHDIKIPLLAEINALKLLENSNNKLIVAMEESCQKTLEMINMLVRLYEKNSAQKDLVIFQNLLNSIFCKLTKIADSKNIDFYCYTNKNIVLETDKKTIELILYNLLLITINESPQFSKVACITKSGMLGTKIKIFSNYSTKQNNKTCNTLKSVGYNIMLEFCKHYIKTNRWLLVEKVNKYNVKSFTIYIPQFKRIFSPIRTSIQSLHHNIPDAGKSVL